MWAVLFTFIAGVVGWFLAKLLADPLFAIYGLRMEVQELLILYGNLKADAPSIEREDAAKRFRTVGAALFAHHLASWWWVERFYRYILQWDPYSAGETCMCYGRLIEGNFSQLNLSPMTPGLRLTLDLPTPRATDRQRRLFTEAGWGDPDARQSSQLPSGEL